VNDFRTEKIPVPKISGRELLIKVAACGVCGSDIPRIYQHGTSNGKYPLTLGHEFSGIVVDTADEKDRGLIGRKGAVFPIIPCGRCEACRREEYAICADYDYLGSRRDGGFAEYCVLPSAWNFVEADDSVSMEELAMAEPAAVALHAVRRARVGKGKSVVIFGAGPIGLMAARWCRIFGAEQILMVDVIDEKVEFAKEHGVMAVNGFEGDLANSMERLFGRRSVQIAIEGTGTGAALVQAINITDTHGIIVFLGNPAKDTVIPMKAHSAILRKELELTGTWNSSYSNKGINEWKYTVKMLEEGSFSCLDLITHMPGIDELPKFTELIRDRKLTACKVMCKCF